MSLDTQFHLPPPPPAAKPKDNGGLVIAGWIFAFIMPLIGFIIGFVLTIKNRPGHGVSQMIVSVLVVVTLFSVAVNDAATEWDSYSACMDNATTLRQMNRCS